MTSTYWVNKIMSSMFADKASSLYIGLSSTYPNADGSNVNEPSGGGYARVSIGQFTSPVDGTLWNGREISFPTATGTWFSPENRALCWVMFDGAASGAKLLCAGELKNSIAVRPGASVKIPYGQIRISLRDLIV